MVFDANATQHYDDTHDVNGVRSGHDGHDSSSPFHGSERKPGPGSRRGRPSFKPPPRIARCLIRAVVKTDVQLTRVFGAIEKAGGAYPGAVRNWFHNLSDTGPNSSHKANNVRLRGGNLTVTRDVELDRAIQIHEVRSTSASREPSAADEASYPSWIPSLTHPPLYGKCRASEQAEVLYTNDRGQIPLVDGYDTRDDIPSSGFSEQSQVLRNTTAYTARMPPAIASGSASNFESLQSAQDLDSSSTENDSSEQVAAEPAPGGIGFDERREKPRKAARLRLSKILGHLNGDAKPSKRRRHVFIIRRCTATREPVRSRVGTNDWIPQRDLESEYMRLYHSKTAFEDAAVQSCQPYGRQKPTNLECDDTFNAMKVIQERRCRLSSLHQGRPLSDKQIDAEIVGELEGITSQLSSAQQAHFVNFKDDNGVTALHLAVAFGFPATCGYLLDRKANHKVVTKRGARPHDFALAAERFAGQQETWRLYYRIMQCREHVRYGKNPPVPKAKQASGGHSPRASGVHQAQRTPPKTHPQQTATHDHAYDTPKNDPDTTSFLGSRATAEQSVMSSLAEPFMPPTSPDFLPIPPSVPNPPPSMYSSSSGLQNSGLFEAYSMPISSRSSATSHNMASAPLSHTTDSINPGQGRHVQPLEDKASQFFQPQFSGQAIDLPRRSDNVSDNLDFTGPFTVPRKDSATGRLKTTTQNVQGIGHFARTQPGYEQYCNALNEQWASRQDHSLFGHGPSELVAPPTDGAQPATFCLVDWQNLNSPWNAPENPGRNHHPAFPASSYQPNPFLPLNPHEMMSYSPPGTLTFPAQLGAGSHMADMLELNSDLSLEFLSNYQPPSPRDIQNGGRDPHLYGQGMPWQQQGTMQRSAPSGHTVFGTDQRFS